MPYSDWVGRVETREDRLDARLVAGMAATLGVERPEVLPPLWHWMLFQDWVMPDRIGPDGHPKRGGFLPPVHELPRRMWAGGRLSFPGASCGRAMRCAGPAPSSRSRRRRAGPAGWSS
jgi:hydroxyacyl-ACP dehydratase HTD2-like protein with hotdog domain